MKSTKFIITGEGGQGIQTIAKVLADAGAKSGYKVSYIPSFGVEQRGTPSVAFLIFSSEEIFYPRFNVADYAVILQQRAIESVLDYISHETKVIFDSSTVSVSKLPKYPKALFGTPVTKYAYEKFIPKSFNVLVIGKLSQILGLKENVVWESLLKTLGSKFKNDEIKKQNHDAYIFGRELVFEVDDYTKPIFVPSDEKIFEKGFNKTAQIIPERCKGCGICIFKCPVGALKFGQILGIYATPVPEIDIEKCITCGNCTRFCPDGAIHVEKEVKK